MRWCGSARCLAALRASPTPRSRSCACTGGSGTCPGLSVAGPPGSRSPAGEVLDPAIRPAPCPSSQPPSRAPNPAHDQMRPVGEAPSPTDRKPPSRTVSAPLAANCARPPGTRTPEPPDLIGGRTGKADDCGTTLIGGADAVERGPLRKYALLRMAHGPGQHDHRRFSASPDAVPAAVKPGTDPVGQLMLTIPEPRTLQGLMASGPDLTSAWVGDCLGAFGSPHPAALSSSRSIRRGALHGRLSAA